MARRSPTPAPSSARLGAEAVRCIHGILAHLGAPATVVTDSASGIVFSHGDTGPFLTRPADDRRRNLLAEARIGLRGPLRRALARASKTGGRELASATLWHAGRQEQVEVAITPVSEAVGGETLFVVSFRTGAPSMIGDAGHRDAIAERETADDDLIRLLSQLDVAAAFFDEELRLHGFTPSAARFLNLLETEIGRPIDELARTTGDDSLVEDAGIAANGSTPSVVEVEDAEGRWHERRVLPARAGDGRMAGIVVTFADVTDRKLTEARQRFLVGEIQHRVRNILAGVRSIANRTLRASDSIDAFAEAFDERLGALGRAQNMIVNESVAEVDLHSLVLDELQAHAARPDENAFVDGPDVLLTLRAAQVFALAINELAMNAVKFGALSAPRGRITVSWSVRESPPERHLVLTWLERNVPKVDAERVGGFGLELIEEGLPYTLGGTSKLEFRDDGISWELDVPLSESVGRPARANGTDRRETIQ